MGYSWEDSTKKYEKNGDMTLVSAIFDVKMACNEQTVMCITMWKVCISI